MPAPCLPQPIDGLGPVNSKKSYPIHREPPTFEDLSTQSEVLYTGIKVIDLLCPFVRGGTLDVMADDQRQVGFRFPVDLIERLDAYAEQMGRVMPGVKFTRADAVKALLEKVMSLIETFCA